MSRLTYARIFIGVREGDDMPEVVCFQSKLSTHIQQLDYESVPFACFHYLNTGNKDFQCPKVKMDQKKIPSSSLNRDKKIWKKKNIILGQTEGSKKFGKMVIEHKKDGDRMHPSSAMSHRNDDVVVPQPKILEQAPKFAKEYEPTNLKDLPKKGDINILGKPNKTQENEDSQVVEGTNALQ